MCACVYVCGRERERELERERESLKEREKERKAKRLNNFAVVSYSCK